MSSTRTDLGARVLTYAELLAREGDEEVRRQLLEGELHLTPSPNLDHQLIVGGVYRALFAHAHAHELGVVLVAPFDVILDEHNVVQPDVLFVARSRRRLLTQRGVQGPPDLVVEMLSPSNAELDRTTKLTIYQRHGVAHYWLLDPATRLLEELVLAPTGYVVRSRLEGGVPFTPALFPDLTIDLSTIWA